MHRFFIAPENIKGDILTIGHEEARHIERVLRLKDGDMAVFFDGMGQEYQVVLQRKENAPLTGRIIYENQRESEPALNLYLVQGIARGDKMDTIVQKATEIGIKAVYPVSCERSVVRLEGEKSEKKVQRWQSIVREACKQCRRNIVPEVMPVMDFPCLLMEIANRPALMLYENEDKNSLKALLQREMYNGAAEIFILVGPEGGFSENEVLTAVKKGVVTASLGSRILRTETAGLVAASIILYEYGDLG